MSAPRHKAALVGAPGGRQRVWCTCGFTSRAFGFLRFAEAALSEHKASHTDA